MDARRNLFTIEQRAPQRDHVKHQHHDQAERNARNATSACHQACPNGKPLSTGNDAVMVERSDRCEGLTEVALTKREARET